MKKNIIREEETKAFSLVENDLNELKAYALLQYALMKESADTGSYVDGSDVYASWLIRNHIKETCNHIEYKLKMLKDTEHGYVPMSGITVIKKTDAL